MDEESGGTPGGCGGCASLTGSCVVSESDKDSG